MSIGDSMKKLIGIEELDEITEEEVNAAKDQLTKQAPMRSAAAMVLTEMMIPFFFILLPAFSNANSF